MGRGSSPTAAKLRYEPRFLPPSCVTEPQIPGRGTRAGGGWGGGVGGGNWGWGGALGREGGGDPPQPPRRWVTNPGSYREAALRNPKFLGVALGPGRDGEGGVGYWKARDLGGKYVVL